MRSTKELIVRWKVPMTPVYDQIYERISQPLMLPTGMVVLDGADLVKIDFQGHLIWRCPHDYGFWGKPVQLKSGGIVCASLDNNVHLINEAGQIVQTYELPSSVSTEILVGHSADLWFGMGALQCAVTRIQPQSGLVTSTYITRDSGIRHPLVQTANGIWVTTNEGLIRVEAQTGQICASSPSNKQGLACVSGALPCDLGVLVVAALPSCSSAIVRVAHDGTVLDQYLFPKLRRARLLAIPQGGIWLVGSTVSAWEPASPSDQIFVARLAADGKPLAVTAAPPKRAIQPTVDSNGYLWVGTYSYDDEHDEESGELTVYGGAAVVCAKWTPDTPAGVGAPILNPNGCGVVATSTALIGFTHPKSMPN